jgi:CIC family chloride channel protein
MGAGSGLLFGTAVHQVWPAAAANPITFALVGMGAFLAAASHAPLMAVILLFEMTMSYDIILPLLLSSVIAYYTARGISGDSLYSEALRRKAAATAPAPSEALVADLMRADPPVVAPGDRFAELARLFLRHRVNNLYVTEADGRFLGAVSLPDIKPYLHEPDLAGLVLARDILREDFPRLAPDQTFTDALAGFLGINAERLPVVDAQGILRGSLAKSDLLLTIAERRKRPAPA